MNMMRALRLSYFQRSLSSQDKVSLLGMYGCIVALHVIGFVMLCTLVVPHNYHLGGDHPGFHRRRSRIRSGYGTPLTRTTSPQSTTPPAN